MPRRPAIMQWVVKAALWLALTSLIFHSLLPLAYQAAMRRADSGGFDSIVICSALGMRMVLVGADGLPLGEQPADGQDDQGERYVPLCLGPPMLPGVLPPADLNATLPLLASGIAFAMWMAAPPHGVDQAPARARGPPARLD